MTLPSVGRIVHYVARGSADGVFPAVCRAAIVTEVRDEDAPVKRVSLCVLNPGGVFFDQSVPYVDRGPIGEGAVPVGGSWHWPERV